MSVPHFLAILIVGLAGYRATRIVTTDSITDPLRAWIWARAYTESGEWDETGRPRVVTRSNRWRWLYMLFDCPWCWGWWQSIAMYAAWNYWHAPFVRPIISAVAVAGLQGFIASKEG